MKADKVSALVIFGATGDLAKLETFPSLVGLVDRDVLDVPIIGVANSGWGLDRFRGYAAESLRRNGIDPDADPAKRMLDLLGMSTATSPTTRRTRLWQRSCRTDRRCSTWRCHRRCSRRSPAAWLEPA